MVKKLQTSFFGFKERQCTMSLIVDRRYIRKGATEFPLTARFTVDRQAYYYPVGGSYTVAEFSDICVAQKSGSKKYQEK